MHLKSISLKGFKSFPDRTKLDFGPGVSVIVGPNGSGKSNITDGVLWALGEQSPLSVRGQSMQDLIFAGGHGVKGRNLAEVEVVIDNSDGAFESEFSELSITRSLDRSGEGTYKLNGARCRLIDVVEVLSDTGLGKEMHSVISQGKVEQIVMSKPNDRTAMIEEAAGLTKYRKRRHRAQLKLNRTQENLDRALDVEREARSRLRPLKRQAEAAELHARLERQGLELRGELTADTLRAVRLELTQAQQAATAARSARDGHEAKMTEAAKEREQVERRFAERSKQRERLSNRLFGARSAAERVSLRIESARERLRTVEARLERSQRALASFGSDDDSSPDDFRGRLSELEAELTRLDAEREQRLEAELADTDAERGRADRDAQSLEQRITDLTEQLDQAEQAGERAREQRAGASKRIEELGREQARLEVELTRIHERLGLLGSDQQGPTLGDKLRVDSGYEGAVAGVLGNRLRAPLVSDIGEGERLVRSGGDAGGRALVRDAGRHNGDVHPPAPGATRLLEHVHPDQEVSALVEVLLFNAWVVTDLDAVPNEFRGMAVTRDGALYNGATREVRRLPSGTTGMGEKAKRAELDRRLLELREELGQATDAAERATTATRESEARSDSLEVELRELRRRREEALETSRRSSWLIEQRRQHGAGPDDARRAELAGELTAERRMVERLEQELAERAKQRDRLAQQIERDAAAIPEAQKTIETMERALVAVTGQRDQFEQALSADEAAGEQVATRLRELAQAEYQLQAQLREASEELTQHEVRVAQVADREQIVSNELSEVARRLGLELDAADEALPEERRTEVEAKLERLERRRENIGPINPLAEQEYKEAIAHVEELEEQRKDLEAALTELQGLIRDTDRRIREAFEETFAAAARNFEEVIEQLFPGGRGRLRRVMPTKPKVVLGGASGEAEDAAEAEEAAAEQDEHASPEELAAKAAADPRDETPGIEIEVTPAGKVPKRLSLLSGGEKSLVALAFMFAVFLARPCPFYILDEVEAALDDSNIDRFLGLVRRFSDRAQFIVITHQRRTMEAADVIYGVSMAKDGVSKVVSRKMEQDGTVTDKELVEAA